MEPLNNNPTKSGVPAGWLVKALLEQGIEIEEMCVQLDLGAELLRSSNLVLPVTTYDNLFEWAAGKLGNSCLGMQVFETLETSDLGVFGYLAINASTLKDWSEIVEKYHCIFSPEFGWKFVETAETYQTVFQEASIPNSYTKQDIDFSMAGITDMIHRQLGEEWQPIRCTFTYPKPSNLDPYRKYFGDTLSFSQPHNMIEIDKEVFSTRISSADPHLLQIFQQMANQLLDELHKDNDLVRHIRLLILAGLGEDDLSTAKIARKVNMSERSLRRRLNESNTSFRELRESTVLRVAKEALTETSANITTIAMKLGYSESSAFVRGFKRLQGVSPLQYRKQAKN